LRTEEFAIYLNYVRKLGFEETPDYDFLRELFTKVLKNSGEVEDGVYDWMLLNNGKGWEAGVRQRFSQRFSLVSSLIFVLLDLVQSSSVLSQSGGYDSRHHRQPRDRDRERERAERHAQRAAAAAIAAARGDPAVGGTGASTPTQPTPAAIARENSKLGRQAPAGGVPGPNASAVAVKGVQPPSGPTTPGLSGGPSGGMTGSKSGGVRGSHPYAANGTGYERGQDGYEPAGTAAYRNGQSQGQQQMNAQNNTGAQAVQQDYQAHQEEDKGGFSLIKLLTCRCG